MSKRSTIAEPAIFCWSNHCLPLSPRWWWVWSSKTEVLNLPLLPAETWSFNRDSLRDSTRRNSRGSKTSDATEELAQLNWDVFGATFVSRWWFQRVLCFQCVSFTCYTFFWEMIQKFDPQKIFRLETVSTTHQRPASGMPTGAPNGGAASQRFSDRGAVPKGKDVTWWGSPCNFKWGVNELGNVFFLIFFFGGGRRKVQQFFDFSCGVQQLMDGWGWYMTYFRCNCNEARK